MTIKFVTKEEKPYIRAKKATRAARYIEFIKNIANVQIVICILQWLDLIL